MSYDEKATENQKRFLLVRSAHYNNGCLDLPISIIDSLNKGEASNLISQIKFIEDHGRLSESNWSKLTPEEFLQEAGRVENE